MSLLPQTRLVWESSTAGGTRMLDRPIGADHPTIALYRGLAADRPETGFDWRVPDDQSRPPCTPLRPFFRPIVKRRTGRG